VPYKLLEQYLCCGRVRVMIRPVWPVVHDNWPYAIRHLKDSFSDIIIAARSHGDFATAG
jgi:hypothetical protein